MSLHHNPKIVTDGLVFAYDMDNAAKSFKGKPTTNIITITDLDGGWSKGYNTSIQWNDYKPPHGVNSQVVSFIDADGNGSGYWYSYGDYVPQQPSTTYTISVYARTIGSDWSIRAYTADNSEVGRQYTNTLTVPGDGKWHRLEFNSITTPSNTESDSLSFQFTTIPAGQRCWLCAPQMEEGTFATPFVNGTRSNTQALLDMSKSKNTVTASSLTYNSDGTFEFDGVGGVGAAGDYLSCGNSSDVNFGTGNFTLSFFSNRTATGYQGGSYVSKGNGTSLGFDFRDSNFYVHGSSGLISSMSFNPSQNSMNHHTFVFDRSSSPYINYYLNGEYSSSSTTNNSANIGSSIDTTRDLDIGRSQAGGVNRYFNGTMPIVKLYNRALTAAEIKQNFNATRKRFGI